MATNPNNAPACRRHLNHWRGRPKKASACGDSGRPRARARTAALSSDFTALRSAPFISPARAPCAEPRAYKWTREGQGRRAVCPATPIRALSARPSSLTLAKSAARSGQRLIASDRAASFDLSVSPMARFHAGGVMNVIGTPAAASTPSMTPRARPNAKAPVGPSPGLALTHSTKAAVAWLLKMIEASNGALTARRPFGPSWTSLRSGRFSPHKNRYSDKVSCR